MRTKQVLFSVMSLVLAATLSYTTGGGGRARASGTAGPTIPSKLANRINWGKPVFIDNFNGRQLNLKNWAIYDDPHADGIKHPRRTKSSVRVRSGSLELIGHHQKPYGYVSGGISSNLNQAYGRWVVRFRADAGAGYAP